MQFIDSFLWGWLVLSIMAYSGYFMCASIAYVYEKLWAGVIGCILVVSGGIFWFIFLISLMINIVQYATKNMS